MNGRIEFNPVRVRTHFIHTLMRMELEQRRQQSAALAAANMAAAAVEAAAVAAAATSVSQHHQRGIAVAAAAAAAAGYGVNHHNPAAAAAAAHAAALSAHHHHHHHHHPSPLAAGPMLSFPIASSSSSSSAPSSSGARKTVTFAEDEGAALDVCDAVGSGVEDRCGAGNVDAGNGTVMALSSPYSSLSHSSPFMHHQQQQQQQPQMMPVPNLHSAPGANSFSRLQSPAPPGVVSSSIPSLSSGAMSSSSSSSMDSSLSSTTKPAFNIEPAHHHHHPYGNFSSSSSPPQFHSSSSSSSVVYPPPPPPPMSSHHVRYDSPGMSLIGTKPDHHPPSFAHPSPLNEPHPPLPRPAHPSVCGFSDTPTNLSMTHHGHHQRQQHSSPHHGLDSSYSQPPEEGVMMSDPTSSSTTVGAGSPLDLPLLGGRGPDDPASIGGDLHQHHHQSQPHHRGIHHQESLSSSMTTEDGGQNSFLSVDGEESTMVAPGPLYDSSHDAHYLPHLQPQQSQQQPSQQHQQHSLHHYHDPGLAAQDMTHSEEKIGEGEFVATSFPHVTGHGDDAAIDYRAARETSQEGGAQLHSRVGFDVEEGEEGEEEEEKATKEQLRLTPISGLLHPMETHSMTSASLHAEENASMPSTESSQVVETVNDNQGGVTESGNTPLDSGSQEGVSSNRSSTSPSSNPSLAHPAGPNEERNDCSASMTDDTACPSRTEQKGDSPSDHPSDSVTDHEKESAGKMEEPEDSSKTSTPKTMELSSSFSSSLSSSSSSSISFVSAAEANLASSTSSPEMEEGFSETTSSPPRLSPASGANDDISGTHEDISGCVGASTASVESDSGFRSAEGSDSDDESTDDLGSLPEKRRRTGERSEAKTTMTTTMTAASVADAKTKKDLDDRFEERQSQQHESSIQPTQQQHHVGISTRSASSTSSSTIADASFGEIIKKSIVEAASA